MTGLTCPNGHAMDDGLFHCPACGAYRPSATDPRAQIKNGRVVGVKPDRRYRHLTGRERQEAIRESNQRAGGDNYGG